MRRPLIIDVTRLLNRARRSTPTGIDRVELAYAEWAASREDSVAVAAGRPGLLRIFGRAQFLQLIGETKTKWSGGDGNSRADAEFSRVLQFLGRPNQSVNRRQPEPPRPRRLPAWPRHMQREAALLLASLTSNRQLPSHGVVLHVSHTGLQNGHRIERLLVQKMPALFFIHDLIPIDTPEFSREGEALKHERRIQTISRHASVVVANSNTTKLSFCNHCEERRWRIPPVEVIPLGIDPVFADPCEPKPVRGPPYFVIVGTIEPRKNHMMLLRIWRRMAKETRSARPRLVIIGRRGWKMEEVAAVLDECGSVESRVIEAAGLNDRQVASLMRGASALLAPSFIEGYGLPVVEALTAGTPVIASDIPVHREIANGYAQFISPLDDAAWLRAVEACVAAEPGVGGTPFSAAPAYQPMTWAKHFTRMKTVLEKITPR